MRKNSRYLAILLMAGMFSIAALAQNVTISGIVQNSSTKELVPAVSVTVKGTGQGTYTDDKGNFRITVAKLPVTLVFSSVGYEDKEVAVTTGSDITVDFVPATALGQEVVVAATRTPLRILESPVSIERMNNQTKFYQGKVRDVYTIDSRWLVMIASDRISAFDVILPKLIPFKGQVLNQIAAYMLDATKDICPNWLLAVPAPTASIGKKCNPFKIEMVVRGNLTGHAWRTYSSGRRELCGVAMPDEMKENDYFASPILTPSTKAEEGHDEDISRDEIIRRNLVTESEWKIIEGYALKLFARGKEIAARRGLILVDTKYEFGKIDDTIYLMDEIHTPDSSRYFYADGFEERQTKGEKQKQLSKEFVREWLIANNFMGKEGQKVPEMTDEWVNTISQRYIELYEQVIGSEFIREPLSQEETYDRIIESLQKLHLT